MKSALELVKIVSMLAAIGAVFWAGLAVISSAKEFGGSGDPSAALWKCGTIFIVAVAINILAGRLNRSAD